MQIYIFISNDQIYFSHFGYWHCKLCNGQLPFTLFGQTFGLVMVISSLPKVTVTESSPFGSMIRLIASLT